jgi:two-component system, LytTR family, response regulator LytT
MRILIVEDEMPAQKRLAKLISEVIPGGEIAGACTSIESAIAWFRENPMPELIFMDVQLSDGRSFEIFDDVQVTAPVIFVTAYDQYALEAFRVQSIDYILKPVTRESLEQAWQKLGEMRKILSAPPDYREKLQSLDPAGRTYKKRFVIRFGEHIRTIPTEEVAFFHTEHKVNFLTTLEGRKFPIDFNLDQLESTLDPERFFRINRQYIIGIHAIADMRAYTKGRVFIHLQPPAPQETIVSVERSAAFKLWLGQGNPET